MQIFDISIRPVKCLVISNCYEWIQTPGYSPWDPVVVGSSEFTLAAVCDCDTATMCIASILSVLSVLILIVKHQFL